jgi:hypothetical protein
MEDGMAKRAQDAGQAPSGGTGSAKSGEADGEARRAATSSEAPATGVLVQICEICGKEYMFEEVEPPDDLRCEKCGNQVFRSFYEDPVPGEAAQDFHDATHRDLATDDPETDVTEGDILDLNNP